MSLLGEKQGVMGSKPSMMEQAAIQEQEAGAAVEASAEEAPVQDEGAQEFEGIVQGIQTLQAGVQDVLNTMINMESQTVSDPEGIAGFLTDMGTLLAKYQGGGEAPTPEGSAPVEA